MAYAGDAPPVRLMQTVATLHSERASPGSAPDLQMFGVGPWPAGEMNLWVLIGSVIKPQSTGRLWLRSADATDAPRIDLGYYSDPADIPRHVEVFRRVRAATRSPQMLALTKEEVAGPSSDDPCDSEPAERRRRDDVDAARAAA